jgi:hypothetical protein
MVPMPPEASTTTLAGALSDKVRPASLCVISVPSRERGIPLVFLCGWVKCAAGFGIVLYTTGNRLGDVMGPTLHDLEAASSP